MVRELSLAVSREAATNKIAGHQFASESSVTPRELHDVGHPGHDPLACADLAGRKFINYGKRQAQEPLPEKVLAVERWPNVDDRPCPPSKRYATTIAYFQKLVVRIENTN